MFKLDQVMYAASLSEFAKTFGIQKFTTMIIVQQNQKKLQFPQSNTGYLK